MLNQITDNKKASGGTMLSRWTRCGPLSPSSGMSMNNAAVLALSLPADWAPAQKTEYITHGPAGMRTVARRVRMSRSAS